MQSMMLESEILSQTCPFYQKNLITMKGRSYNEFPFRGKQNSALLRR